MVQRRGLRPRRGAHRPAESVNAWATILSWAIVAAVFAAVCIGAVWLLTFTSSMQSKPSQPQTQAGEQPVQDEQDEIPTEAPLVSEPSPSTSFSAPAVDKDDYKVQVLNGSGTAGQAGAVKKILQADGWKVSKIGNADDTSLTVIRYPKPAAKDAALAVQAALQAGTLEQDSDVSSVVVILGSDYP